MMIKISPAEYMYLDRPYRSEPDDLIRATLQALCFKNVLTAEEKYTFLNDNDPREVLRLFLKPGPAFTNYKTGSRAEKFLLDFFTGQEEIRFFELRNYVLFELDKDTSAFKWEFMCKDLKEKGLL